MMRKSLGSIARFALGLGGALALAGCASKERVTLLSPAQAGKDVGGVVVEYDGGEAYLSRPNQQAKLKGVKAPRFKQFDQADPFYTELMSDLPPLAVREFFYFAFGEGTLGPDQLDALQAWLAANIQDRPGLHIEIAAHTDATGSEAVNTQLSQERAEAVLGQVMERIEAGAIDVNRDDIDVVASSLHWAQSVQQSDPANYNPEAFRVVVVTVR